MRNRRTTISTVVAMSFCAVIGIVATAVTMMQTPVSAAGSDRAAHQMTATHAYTQRTYNEDELCRMAGAFHAAQYGEARAFTADSAHSAEGYVCLIADRGESAAFYIIQAQTLRGVDAAGNPVDFTPYS